MTTHLFFIIFLFFTAIKPQWNNKRARCGSGVSGCRLLIQPVFWGIPNKCESKSRIRLQLGTSRQLLCSISDWTFRSKSSQLDASLRHQVHSKKKLQMTNTFSLTVKLKSLLTCHGTVHSCNQRSFREFSVWPKGLWSVGKDKVVKMY